MSDNLKNILNKEQYEAVTYGDGPLLVLAGAGSGKTRVLTYRYAYLVSEKNVSPRNILAITFTNKAALEMKSRINALLGEALSGSWIGTFHWCCGRILRRHAKAIGYDENFTIYAEPESLETVKTAIKELDLDEKAFPPRMLRGIIGKFKDRMLTPDEAAEEAEDYYSRKHAEVYKRYQEILTASNSMDFDDMILNVIRLWENAPEILDYYRNTFRYILVDEYQDTNMAQHRMVNMLSGRGGNLCVVGDDDQSIYGFRGADIDNILRFSDTHDGTKVVKLEQNYRSTEKILKVANDIISANSFRTGKKLWTSTSGGDPVVRYTAGDNNEEADFICGQIRSLTGTGTMNYSDFAVLYRVNAISTGIERALTRMRIPYRVFGGMKFYDRKEIKDLVAYLRIIGNPADESSLRRIINVPRRGIGNTTVDNISACARSRGTAMLAVIESAGIYPELSKVKSKLTAFADMIRELRKSLSECETLTDFVQKVIDETGIAQEYINDHTPESDAKAENISEFLSVAKNFEENNDENYESAGAIFPDFLESVSLNTESDGTGDEDDQNRVTLTTVHSAKGLEFPVVFIAGMEDGIFPSIRSIEEDGSIAEERRLMYVAVTRAREKLFITSCLSRMIYGKTQSYTPSRFLKDIHDGDAEISGAAAGRYGVFSAENRREAPRGPVFGRTPESFIGSAGKIQGGKQGGSRDRADRITGAPGSAFNSPKSVSGTAGTGFSRFVPVPGQDGDKAYLREVVRGQRVFHKKFGEGTVSSVAGSGDAAVVEIIFDRSGMKRLMLAYAKLTACD